MYFVIFVTKNRFIDTVPLITQGIIIRKNIFNAHFISETLLVHFKVSLDVFELAISFDIDSASWISLQDTTIYYDA